MSNVNSDDKFLKELEAGVRAILVNRKASKSEKLQAITAGVKVAQIRHKISGSGEEEKGFFGND
jgi:hypothetical protein